MHRGLHLKEQFRTLVDVAARWSGAEAAVVYAPADQPDALVPVVSTLAEDDARRGALRSVARERAGEIVGTGPEHGMRGLGPFLLGPDAWPGPAPTASAALAVRGEGSEVVALLLVVGVASEDPTSRAALHALLDAIRPAIANGVRVESMKELIIKDDTASCFNRRHFEESLPEELSRAVRFRSPLSIIFFDLDNLKQVNSRHGHAMGSRTLFEVSARVRAKIRKFDKLFRFGGDEFVILLPETEWHGALEVAERVREAIASTPFLRGLVADPEGVPITASFGIASYPLHARTQQEMIQCADRAMQRIKTGTKNSIAIAEIAGEEHDD